MQKKYAKGDLLVVKSEDGMFYPAQVENADKVDIDMYEVSFRDDMGQRNTLWFYSGRCGRYSIHETAYETPPEGVKPDSLWLVVYECRYDVVRVSPDGQGFFAPGQDPCWPFSAASKWVREIIPPKE